MSPFFKKFTKPINLYLLIYCVSMIFLHSWQFVHSGFRPEPLARLVCYSVGTVIFLMTQKYPVLYIVGFIQSLFFIYFQDFTYYMGFWFLLLCINKWPKQKLLFIIPYLINICIVASLHDKQPSHIYIHLLNCGMMFFLDRQSHNDNITQLNNSIQKPLILLHDDIIILNALKNGDKQKSIPGMSASTVSRRITECMTRNDCSSREELLFRFISENN